MSDFENIPETLRERDQWLFWNASNDTPRAPLDSPAASYGCSWSDPDTWMSFEAVREQAEDVADAGIGYVNAKDNGDHPRGIIGSIDIDGVVDEDGKPKDWLPSMQPFFDHGAYVEYSPSDTGLRVPIIGMETPDWWADSHFSAEEHEGVEVLTNKFSTYTGNQLRDSAGTAAEYGEWVDEWLREVYKVINGEDPLEAESVDTDDSEYTGNDEWLTEDAAEEALDAINADVSYDTWKDIGMALANCFGTARGKSLFTQWSRGGTKWDNDAKKQAERIINDASSYDYDAGTLVYHATNHGWDASTAAREYGSGRPSGAADTTDSDDTGDQSSNGTPVSEANGMLYITKTSREGEIYEERLTNFVMDVDAVLKRDNGDTEFLITLDPLTGGERQIAVEPKVFNEKRKFESKVCGELLSGTYDGDPSDLNRLKEYVARQDAPVRRGTEHIGLHDDEWVVPGGTLRADGWTEDPETVHEAADTPLSNKYALDPDDGADYDRETVQDILRLLPQTRLTERFLPAMGWFYAAVTRPYIQDWEGEFNILAVTGDTGAGKTATLETLWSCFGVEGDLLRADGTTFPKMRALATSNALPVVFDEYKPADMAEYRKDSLHSLLRTSTRGGIEEKGRPDGSVVGHQLLAPVVISGEQALRGTAEERRTLQTNFSRQASVGGSPESEAFARLTGGETSDGISDGLDLTEHGLAYARWILQQDERHLKALWDAAKAKASNALGELDINSIDDMRLQAVQTMVYGCRLYQTFAEDMGLADTPVDEAGIDSAVSYILGERTSTTHVSNLDRFLALAGRAASAEYLKRGEHFEIIREGEPDEELRFKLSLVFDQLRRYARDHDIKDADLLDSDTDYRSRIKDAADDASSYVLDASKQTRGLNRCVAVSLPDAAGQIDALEVGLFRDVDDDEADTEGDVEFEDATPEFALSDLDPSRGAPVTFRATLASKLEPKPWLQAEGIIQDDSGVARFIARGDSNPVSGIDEARKIEVRDAMVTTNDDGAPVVEFIDGLTDVIDVSVPDDQSGLEEASTDGGRDRDAAELEPANEDVDQFIAGIASGDTVSVAEVAGAVGAKPDHVEQRLDTLVSERGVLRETDAGDYERL